MQQIVCVCVCVCVCVSHSGRGELYSRPQGASGGQAVRVHVCVCVCVCVFMQCVVAPLGGNDSVPLGSGCLCLSPLAAQGKNRQYMERKKEQHHMASVL